MDPMQRQKRLDFWYKFVVYSTTTIFFGLIGGAFFANIRTRRRTRDARDRNFDLIKNEIKPVYDMEVARHPSKRISFIVGVCNKDDKSLFESTNSSAILGSNYGDNGVYRLD